MQHCGLICGMRLIDVYKIQEQPKAVQDTLNSVLKDGAIDLSSVGLTEEELQSFSQVYIVACGSAYHVGVACQYRCV